MVEEIAEAGEGTKRSWSFRDAFPSMELGNERKRDLPEYTGTCTPRHSGSVPEPESSETATLLAWFERE